MTRIAISAEDANGLDSIVSPHFGRCPCFVLVDLDGQTVTSVRSIENPYFGHHEPGQVPAFIRSLGAQVMLSGGMGARAMAFFQEQGIQIATGASGTVRVALESYLAGTLETAPCAESMEHKHHLGDTHKKGKVSHS